MKVKFYLAMAVAAFLMTNCSQDENLIQTKGSTNTLTAAIESASRSTVTDGGIFAWDENDAIAVGNAEGSYTKFEYNGETFTAGTAIVPTGYAIYPYNEAYTSLSEEVPTITLSNEYAYGSTNAPMLATITEGETSLTFNHLAGLMRFRVKGIQNATEFSLTAEGKDITGTFTPGTDNEGKTCINAGTTGTNNEVKITFTANDIKDVMDFYVPMPVGEYTSLKVKIGNKELASSNGVTNTIARGKLLLMPTMVFDSNGDLILEGGNNVSLNHEDEVNLEVSDGEEVVVEMAQGTTATLNLSAPENSSEGLSISDGSAEGTESSESQATLNVSVENASSLDINTPTLTVNLESGNFEEVTALTAQSTLIINTGVSVGKLNLKGGNIILHGSITREITCESEGEDIIYIILGEGVEAPTTTLPNNVKIVTAAEYELIKAIEKGGNQTIVLNKDVELTHPLTLNDSGANITIDLGTYSLTNKTAYDYDNCGETECYVFEVKAGTLNISGTTGSVNANGGSDYDMAVFANGTGKVNISGGKFTNTGKENDGSDLIYVRDNAAVTISGGEFEAGNKSSDVGNQYVALNLRDADRTAGTCSITVTGGKFHKFNPANNVSEGALTNFTANNIIVAVSGTEGAEVYEVIDLTNGYTLTSNIEITTPIMINTTGEIALNLGAYSLTNKTAYDYDNCGETECYVFEVKAGTLNISGTTGSVNANGGSDYDMAVFANGTGKVNISGGKFTNTGKENDGSDLIYVRDNAAVTISGGEFEAGNKSSDVGNQYVALNLRDADRTTGTCSITVTGGKFHKFNPANNISEGANTNFVAEGYESIESEENNEKVYTVSASSTEE